MQTKTGFATYSKVTLNESYYGHKINYNDTAAFLITE